LLLAFIYPVWIFLASVMISGINASWIKNQLNSANVYPVLVDSLNQTMDTAVAKNHDSGDLQAIVPIVKKEITPNLVKKKMEKLVDDTADWLTGNTNLSPSISFIELKDIIIAQNPALARQLNISSGTETAKTVPIDPEYDYGLAHPAPTSVIDQAINNKLNFPVGKYFPFLKQFYDIVRIGFWVMTVIMSVAITGIFISVTTLKSGWRFTGFTGFFLICWNIVPFILLASPALIISVISSYADKNYAMLVPILIKPVLAKIVMEEVIITGIFSLLSFSALIISFIPECKKRI
jgi:hypothetical protein